MFGLNDFWIWSPFLLCILSALLCVIYGAVMWNKGGDDEPSRDAVEWAKEEDKIDEDL